MRGRVSAGELVNLPSEDTRMAARAVSEIGFFFNNFAMFMVGSALVWSIHPLLGGIVIAGSVVTAVVTGPLLGRLQRRQADYREMIGDLTAQAADIVGGLRVLRGIGGDLMFAARYRERSAALRDSGYRVANSSSWIHALRSSMPIVFVAVITWTGALLAVERRDHHRRPGLGVQLRDHLHRRLRELHRLRELPRRRLGGLRSPHPVPRHRDRCGRQGTVHGDGGELRDPDSGLTVPVGGLTVLVTAETAPALEACERLARYRDSKRSGARIPWRRMRSRRCASGSCCSPTRTTCSPPRSPRRCGSTGRGVTAIETACAADVYTGLGGTFDGRIAEGGRNLSGGQRQRLRLARALAAEPETLLAVEPTSAVDSHTESLIAERVAAARAAGGPRWSWPPRRCGWAAPTAWCGWSRARSTPSAPTPNCCTTPPTAASPPTTEKICRRPHEHCRAEASG